MLAKLKTLGPGLLYAGAAIGVSHLVQSTKAGAQYGYVLIIAIILAHLFKYPFFAAGPRYAQHSGKSLVEGFAKIGKWAVLLLLVLTVTTMFTVQAAVTIVTAGLAQKLTGINLPPWQWSAILLALCFLILQVGKFNVLDQLMKVIMIVLSLSTILAFAFSFGVEKSFADEGMKIFTITEESDLAFLISFVGWMPAPLDIAIWHSIWSITNPNKSINKGNFDFNVGFYGTAILGICFLILGANTLYGTGMQIESSAGKFASQLVDIFTLSLGPWSYYIIVIAAFTTMFSTTLTCLDAMPRVMGRISGQLRFPSMVTARVWMIILVFGALIILGQFVESMGQMVKLATTISFLTAPLLAYLTYRLVSIEKHNFAIWNDTEKRLAQIGLILLLALSVLYIIQML
ncbi:MAG: divalent metal cation transporter [Bacteroidia bacterium]|nr:divalent metal cation transporter [Bacteroidia bacterium]NNJ56765.1 divalent metal cation transporter [Bacteroidia bacterium]